MGCFPRNVQARMTHVKKYEQLIKNIKSNAYETNMGQFAHDLAELYEVQYNPKFKLVYWKAYEYGHTKGLESILMYFADLVPLIK